MDRPHRPSGLIPSCGLLALNPCPDHFNLFDPSVGMVSSDVRPNLLAPPYHGRAVRSFFNGDVGQPKRQAMIRTTCATFREFRGFPPHGLLHLVGAPYNCHAPVEGWKQVLLNKLMRLSATLLKEPILPPRLFLNSVQSLPLLGMLAPLISGPPNLQIDAKRLSMFTFPSAKSVAHRPLNT